MNPHRHLDPPGSSARSEMAAAALAYAQDGWAVFPCHHPVGDRCSCASPECTSIAKHPMTRRGLRDATTNPNLIGRWWRAWPAANVAIRTGAASGLVVLDIDPHHHGHASLADLTARHGPFPPTSTVTTGCGGLHLYFAHPGGTIRNSAGTRLGSGIDVRGDGGYVIAPPSRHRCGTRYQHHDATKPAPLPEWLSDHLQRSAPAPPPRCPPVPCNGSLSAWAAAAVGGELARLRSSQPGTRNDTLNRSAFALGQLAGAGHLAAADVEDLLVQAGLATGLSAREVHATVRSGLSAGERHPRNPADQPLPGSPCGDLPIPAPPTVEPPGFAR